MKLLYLGIVTFCLFPYLAILPIETDSQPNALILSCLSLIILLIRNPISITRDFLYLLIIAIISVVLVAFSSDSFAALRCSANYVSLFIVTYVCYTFIKQFGIINYNFFKVIVIIWFTVGLIQTLINPTFLLFLQPRNIIAEAFLSDRGGRGVLGLAPEPTYYGFVCLQQLIFAIINYAQCKRIKLYILLIISQLLLFNRSTTALLMMILAFIIYMCINLSSINIKILKLFIGGGILLLIITIAVSTTETRMGKVIRNIYEGKNIAVEDASANERLAHIIVSTKGSIDNFGFPNGYEKFSDYYKGEVRNGGELYSDYLSRGAENKIMSSIGGMMFELGFFISLLFFTVIFKIYKYAKHNNQILLFCLILYTLCLLNALPFAQGFNCLLLANILYIKDYSKGLNYAHSSSN